MHSARSVHEARSGGTRTASAILKAPRVNEPEAEADSVEVKDALDESGAAKITD